MYKLILVEDEDIVRSGLKNGINWQEQGFEVAGTAANGIEALDVIERLNPDVVLTDIRMPDMDGLQLMKILHQQYPEVEIVILSGFSDFEYACAGMRYGAFAYITKPVNAAELYSIFRNLKDKIKKKRKEALAGKYPGVPEYRPDMEKVRDVFLSTLISKDLDHGFIQRSFAEMDIHFSGECFCIAAFQPEADEPDVEPQQLMAVNRTFGQYLKERDLLYVLHNEVWTVFMSRNRTCLEQVFAKDAEDCKTYLEDRLAADFHFRIHVNAGMSIGASGYERLTEAYRQAVTALKFKFFKGKGAFTPYSEIRFKKPDAKESDRLGGLVDRILEVVEDADSQKAARNCNALFSCLQKAMPKDVTFLYIRCMEMLVLLDNKYKEKGVSLSELKNKEELYAEIFGKGTLDELRKWFLLKLERAVKEEALILQEQSKDLIKQVKRYITENIKDKITLYDIATAVHVSTNYLSASFAKETGVNLIQYVTNRKIEKAKEYLEKSDMRIQTISEELGFTDYRYFCTVFKKETGMTPLHFRAKKYN